MREHFDRHVRFLPEEGKYVVFLRHFRGQIEVEEAAFFVEDVDPATGEVALSDGTREALDVGSLHDSPIDGAWLCRVKRDLAAEGLLARFSREAQARLAACAEERGERAGVVLAGRFVPLPEALV